LGGAACSLAAAGIALPPRLAETDSAKLERAGGLVQAPVRPLRVRMFGVVGPDGDHVVFQPAFMQRRQAWAAGEALAPHGADAAARPRPAPAAPEREASSRALYRAELREEVLRQLHEFGIVPSADRRVLSDARLDQIAGGQAAAGTAPGGDSADGPADPELTALNRVLVEKGGLLLRPWSVELQPEVSYSYKGSNGLLIVDDNGRRTAVAHDVDLNRLETALIGRLGLPWRSQAEVKVPYLYAQEDSSSGVQSDSRSQAGLGDMEFALTHQFVRESGWLPDLLLEGRWKTNTGEDAFDGGNGTLPLGTGFNGLSARVTAVKTVDPVVLVGTAGYTRNLEGNREDFRIDPGDQWLGSLGAVLAAGPGVSLRSGISVGFSDEATVDGDRVAGSDRVDARLNFGIGATITEKVLVDFGFGAGVTDDAPDFTTRAGLAYRF
jgi:Putative MetA-pathway of phenol degradation